MTAAHGGHKTRSVFDRYNIVRERDLHEAAARLERHVAELEKACDGHTLGTPGGISDRVEVNSSLNESRRLLN